MGEREDAWRRVEEQFKALGARFKDHYDEAGTEKEPSAAETAEVKEAVQAVGEALNRVFGSVGKALRDPDVKEEGKHAATSLVEALNVTFSEVGESIRRALQRDDDLEAPDTWSGPDEDAGQGADGPEA